MISVIDFGADPTGSVDCTANVQAAIDAAYTAGGGDVFFPEGIYLITSLSKVWNASISVNLRGEGRRATILRKTGGTTTPIIDFSTANSSILETMSSISDMRIQGNSQAHHGIKLTDFARFDITRVLIDTCDVGFENLGALVFSVYDSYFQGNNIGYRCRKATSNVRPNLVQFFGGAISGNDDFAIDIGDAAGVHMIGVDMSGNGTANNTGTGAVILRSTMDDEFGYSNFSMKGCWFESNKGWTFRTEACSGLFIDVTDTFVIGSESGRAMDINTAFSVALSGVIAGSAGDTVQIAASRSSVRDSLIATLTDTSTKYRHINISTTSAEYEDVFKGPFKRMKLSSQDFLYGRSDQISGGGSDDIEYYLYGTGNQRFMVNGTRPLTIGADAIGFYGTSPIAKPTVTGSRGGNAALADLLTELANLGLITDSTSA
jgi:hypothetical protein